MSVENLINYSLPFAIILNIVVSLVIAIKLYLNAPEKNDIGFNKYWQTLMMDSYPSHDKNLLIYDDNPQRKKLFWLHKMVSIGVMVFIVINVILTLALN